VFQAGRDDLGDPFGEPAGPWEVGHRSVLLNIVSVVVLGHVTDVLGATPQDYPR
jgi:hypothetical protein